MTTENSIIYNPTKLIIKKDGAADIAKYIKQDGVKKVLLVHGMESAKKYGVFDKITKALSEEGIQFVELGGVRPNPEIHKVVEGVALIRSEKVDALLAVGGGSTIDTTKAMSAGWSLDCEPTVENMWSVFEKQPQLTKALPIYTVLTISATASEMDNGCVIQYDAQRKKWGYLDKLLYPRVSIIDPKLQETLPWYQQVNGFVDAFVHTLEEVTNVDDPESVETTFAHDEANLRSIIKCGNALKADQKNYNARANFCWAASFALNGNADVFCKGGCWAVHYLEHAIGAIYPEVSHGAGLGVVFPAFVKANAIRGKRLTQYNRLAKEVFGREGWEGLIDGFKAMLRNWRHPTSLNELLGREVTEQERKEIADAYMLRPYCGYEKIQRDLVDDVYKFM